MHKRIDLTLILCAFALHREARVAETTTYGRTVILRRCVRCSRHLAARGTRRTRRTADGAACRVALHMKRQQC